MAKPLRKRNKRLAQRQAAFDQIRDPKTKKAMKRPGSMNPHKSAGARRSNG